MNLSAIIIQKFFIGDDFMATSSITHNFVLTERESIEGFIRAIEEAERDRPVARPLQGRLLTDGNEIVNLMAKRNGRKIFSR